MYLESKQIYILLSEYCSNNQIENFKKSEINQNPQNISFMTSRQCVQLKVPILPLSTTRRVGI